MATADRDLAEQVAHHLRETTIDYREYLRRKTQDPKYDWTASHWGRAFALLDQVGASPSPPPPSQVLGHNIIFATSNPKEPFSAKPHYSIAWSADPRYRQWATGPYVANAKLQGRRQYAWCDCMMTLPEVAIQAVHDYNLDGWIGQAESDEQFIIAISAQANIIIGRGLSLSQSNRNKATYLVNQRLLTWVEEAYTNHGDPWPKDVSAGGIPASSECIGLWDDSNEAGGWYAPSALYQTNTPPAIWLGICAYVENARAGDIEALP